MSAIFGILRFDGGAVNPRDLERMGNTLAHRGPDGRKFTVDGAVGLGHCLMRVNQEDLFERQPIVDRVAELTLVADCRIDNREKPAGIAGATDFDGADIEPIHNSLLMFPSWAPHEVMPVNCPSQRFIDSRFAINCWVHRERPDTGTQP
jgi:asparagine synthetase B (glutamine-hydrolysing)